jgi:GNAT superfamily N-acetyltransferase
VGRVREAGRRQCRLGLPVALGRAPGIVVPAGLAARYARLFDAPAIAALLVRGFDTYREWAPGWDPPATLAAAQVVGWSRSLAERERWTVVVEEHASPAEPVAVAKPVAVASFAQARTGTGGRAEPIEGLAHLGALFVERRWWGRGVAPALLEAATAEMAARGFARGRLLVPAGHARACALYARHGWEPVDERFDERIGLPLLELRRDLTAG